MILKNNIILKNVVKFFIKSNAIYILRELSNCTSILDLGCGRKSLLREVVGPYKVGVDIFLPYLKESKMKKIHNDYILGDLRNIEFKDSSFDCVIAIEVLEHLTKKDGYNLIKKMEKWARKKIIITTPNGFIPQNEYDYNPFQKHRSGWTVDEFRRLGFKVKGLNGLKILRGEKALPRIKPRIIGSIISHISQIITYHKPEYAFQILAVKEINRTA